MDIYEDLNITEEIIPKKRKNITKRLNEQIKCSEILTKEQCELKKECMFSKTLKCRKKIQTKLKPLTTKKTEFIIVDDSTDLKSSTPLSDKLQENPKVDKSSCKEIDTLRNELNSIRKDYDTKIRECEEELFGEFITKYFNKGEDKLTHKDLLVGLQKYYIEEKIKDINFILSMQEFIQKFSQKNSYKRFKL